jgi:hypothetical protein
MRKWIVPAASALLLILGACPGSKDTVSPTVEITAPANGDTLVADSIVITAHATDSVGVAAVRFYVDATEIAVDSTPASGNYSAVWNVPAETLGTFKIKARANDAAENVGEDSVVIFARKAGPPPTYHGGTLTADEVWLVANNPHVCTTAVVVDGSHKLTLEPGCKVRFRKGAGIIVGQASAGELIAVGSAGSLIQFTSDSSAPNPGDWTGIAFHANAAPTTHLSYCGLDYGGLSSGGALVASPGAQFSVDHCTVARSAGAGLLCEGDGHPTDFTDNSIAGCLSYPVRIKAEYIRYLGAGNVLTGNTLGKDAIFVVGSGVVTSTTWRNLGAPYQVSGDVSIADASGPVVTIEPGTTIKLGSSTVISVGQDPLPGGLRADASGGQQIVFTSSLPTPKRGDWQYIYFDAVAIDSVCMLKNCRIQFGGSDSTGEIFLLNAKPEIRGCAVDSSAGYGIDLYGFAAELPRKDSLRANNTFTGNVKGDIIGP